MSKKKETNNLIRWFIDEGAIKQEGNLYIAPRAFQANSFVNWIRENSINKALDEKVIEQSMMAIKMFLKKKIDLQWKDGTIDVSDGWEPESDAIANSSAPGAE
jgi:hypothetical protein